MNETPQLAQNRWIFFISRLFIMAGMVLVFASLFGLLGYALGKAIGIDLIHMNDILLEPEKNSTGMLAVKIFQVLASIGTFLIPALIFPRAINISPKQFLKVKLNSGVLTFLIGVSIILLSAPLVSYIYGLNQMITFPEAWKGLEDSLKAMEESAKQLTDAFIKTNSTPELILNLFVVAVIPAVAEEFFFRGCLQNFVRMCFYNTHIAILFTAIVFSGFHGQFYGFFPRVLLGIVLGYIYAYSGNIWVPIFAHFINNALALVGNLLYSQNPDLNFLSETYQFPLWITALSSGLCVIAIWYLNELRYKRLTAHE